MAEEPARAGVFGNPGWFPESFDVRRREFHFVSTERTTLAAQTFLDARWDRAGRDRRVETAESLLAHLPKEKPKPTIVWHTGFCCSTLLTRALDRPGNNLALCEPLVLVAIADAKRSGTLGRGPLQAAPALALHLLGRGFSAGESVTIKPSPAANNLLPESISQSSGPMLFLYSDCKSFLVSIYRLREEGRKYVRQLLLTILGDGHPQAQWRPAQLLSLTDLELAAVLWHMQIEEFRRAVALLDSNRFASLDCDAFLASPVETLNRLDDFFSLRLGNEYLQQVAAGPLFRTNAKTGKESFDATRRRAEHSQAAEQMTGEFERIVKWSYGVCRCNPGSHPLPNALMPITKAYGCQ